MIDLAVIGCGYWGPNLIRNFHSHEDCCMSLACDIRQDRLDYIKHRFPNIETTADMNTVFSSTRIEAVVVATPVSQHFPMAKAALEAGKHVFIEKPMAGNSDQCQQLIDLAEKKGLTIMIGHTFVFSSPVRKVKEIVASGELGQVNYIGSRRLNLGLFQKDINVAWDLVPHDISIIHHIMNKRPVSVNCQGWAHYQQGIEDVASTSIVFEDGLFTTIWSSWLDPNKVREMTFVGDRKMLVYNDLAPLEKIKIFDKRVETPPYYNTYAEFHYSYHYGETYSPFFEQVEPLAMETRHFLDCIMSGDKPVSGGEEGKLVVQVLEAASESLRRGGAQIEIVVS